MRTTLQLIDEIRDINTRLLAGTGNDLTSLMNNLQWLEAQLARCVEIVGEAKYLRDCAVNELLADGGRLNQSTLNPALKSKLLASLTAEQNYAVELAEGLSQCIRCTMDCQRTRISELKEELRQLHEPVMRAEELVNPATGEILRHRKS